MAVLKVDDDLHVQIYAPPSRLLLDVLEAATNALRIALARVHDGS